MRKKGIASSRPGSAAGIKNQGDIIGTAARTFIVYIMRFSKFDIY
jgi:hypothetical protein